jgi:hypothetical protein
MELSMTNEQLDNWFSYHSPSLDDLHRYQEIREAARTFARTINLLVPESADKTAAMRKLRECVMTANAAVACGGK